LSAVPITLTCNQLVQLGMFSSLLPREPQTVAMNELQIMILVSQEITKY